MLRVIESAAATAPLMQTTKPGSLIVSMHEASSDGFDFRTAMEGYARAGIRAVEPTLTKIREFIQKESPAVARRLLDDLGLHPVSSSNQLALVEPNEARARSLEDLKWKIELAQAIGCDRIVAPSTGTGDYTEDDYKRGVDNLREAGEIAQPFGVSVMLEFTRTSRFAASLPTALDLVRAANHPNVRVMLDTFHFWGGISKFEDLELLRDGELHHLHFEDVPARPPREIQGQPNRVFPGEGIAPLQRIVELLKRKKYAASVSLEMFSPAIQSMDPYLVGMKARATIEPLLA
jgi:2-keto-myo-inositol isomerase